MKTNVVPIDLYRHPAWLAWKEAQGWRRLSAPGLGFPVLLRPLGAGHSMAYAAPTGLAGQDGTMSEDAGAILERLSQRALPFLPRDCAFIRWEVAAKPWLNSDGWPLDPRLQELRMNASTATRSLRKTVAEQICPDTKLVDLEGGEEAVRARFDERTRYSLRLAERRGTMVESAGADGIGAFHSLHAATSRRHRLPCHGVEYFRALFEAGETWGLDLDLYLAWSGARPAAGAIFARTGGDAWYLFAASSSDLRSAAGPTAILARALSDCAERGLGSMDLLGVGPAGAKDHPLSGLTRFKAGFGGRRCARAGAWDFVLKPPVYARCVLASLAKELKR
ncbi:peptidoglycan bridge formation glycyltransferase FemA/FemB family protein [bacterium]|nr:peptidoglycan bridge formation glycyltransferase FemA/FemB family protein [bacterium]